MRLGHQEAPGTWVDTWQNDRVFLFDHSIPSPTRKAAGFGRPPTRGRSACQAWLLRLGAPSWLSRLHVP